MECCLLYIGRYGLGLELMGLREPLSLDDDNPFSNSILYRFLSSLKAEMALWQDSA